MGTQSQMSIQSLRMKLVNRVKTELAATLARLGHIVPTP
jgi:hypothetical protein